MIFSSGGRIFAFALGEVWRVFLQDRVIISMAESPRKARRPESIS